MTIYHLRLIVISLIQEPLHLIEVSTEQNESTDSTRVQHSYKTNEQDDQSCNSILTNNDESVPTERSNQHNMIVAAEGFEVPCNLKYLDDEDLIPAVKSFFLNHLFMQIILKIQRTNHFLSVFQDLLYMYNNGLSVDELPWELLESANNYDWIQNQNITDKEDDEFLDSIFVDEAYLQEGNGEQCLTADNEGFNLPCKDVMESFNSIEKTRKRPRLEYDGISHHAETGSINLGEKNTPIVANQNKLIPMTKW